MFATRPYRRIEIGADDIRHHRRINDAQAVYAAQPQLSVDDRVVVRFHAASAARMEFGHQTLAQHALDLGISPDPVAWNDFAGAEPGNRRLRNDVARDLQALAHVD